MTTLDDEGWLITIPEHTQAYYRALETFYLEVEMDKRNKRLLKNSLKKRLEEAGLLTIFDTKTPIHRLIASNILSLPHTDDNTIFRMMNVQAALQSTTNDTITEEDIILYPSTLYEIGGREALTVYVDIILDYMSTIKRKEDVMVNKLTIFSEAAIRVLER